MSALSKKNKNIYLVILGWLLAVPLAFFVFLGSAEVRASWQPPLGIPQPSWPEDLDILRPSYPAPWNAEQAGWYFINNIAGCSDSRTYGYPNAPRCSFPASPASGSKVVLHGTVSGAKNISWHGTSQSPIWIMGYQNEARPTVTNYWSVEGSYLIIDGLNWSYSSQDGNSVGGDHVMIRDCSYANPYDSANGAAWAPYGSNIIFYGITVSQMGNWQYAGGSDIDRLGMKVWEGASEVWVVDSLFYHCHSDGIQVGDHVFEPSSINKIYIGRNTAYENYQACFWTKDASDVIFSENTCYNQKTRSESSVGAGMGGQYDAQYVWYLANTIYNANTGLMFGSGDHGGGGPWFAIGNNISDIANDNTCNPYDNGAISFRNEGGLTALFNTFYDANIFMAVPPGATVTARSNIMSIKKQTSPCDAIVVEGELVHDYNLFSDASYDPGSEPHRVVGDPAFTNPLIRNFSLTAGSPAVNAAREQEESAFALFQSRYGLDIRKDILGITRPQGGHWDIGSHEFADGHGDVVPPASPTNLAVR